MRGRPATHVGGPWPNADVKKVQVGNDERLGKAEQDESRLAVCQTVCVNNDACNRAPQSTVAAMARVLLHTGDGLLVVPAADQRQRAPRDVLPRNSRSSARSSSAVAPRGRS